MSGLSNLYFQHFQYRESVPETAFSQEISYRSKCFSVRWDLLKTRTPRPKSFLYTLGIASQNNNYDDISPVSTSSINWQKFGPVTIFVE